MNIRPDAHKNSTSRSMSASLRLGRSRNNNRNARRNTRCSARCNTQFSTRFFALLATTLAVVVGVLLSIYTPPLIARAQGSVAHSAQDPAAQTSLYMDARDGNDTNDGLTAQTPVKTFAKAKQLAKDNQNIKTIYARWTQKIEGEISLKGTNAIIKRWPQYGNYLFKVEKGKEATLSDITIDGNFAEIPKVKDALIRVDGTLNIKDGAILQNNHATYARDIQALRGGAIFCSGTINMTGGIIRNNEATRGGGIYLCSPNYSGDLLIKGTYKSSVMNFSGGIIENNKAKDRDDPNISYSIGKPAAAGGGICAVEGAVVNMSGTATVSNNHSDYAGGGISIGDTTATWPSNILNMTGGKITHNTAGGCGGGILVQGGMKDDELTKKTNVNFNFPGIANISAGEITHNKALCETGLNEFGGGGIYVNGINHSQYTNGILNLTNAIIKENSATYHGGGFAGCPSSKTNFYLREGAAMFNNKAPWAREIYLESGNRGFAHAGVHPYSISPVMLGGTPYMWENYNGTSQYWLSDLTGTVEANGTPLAEGSANKYLEFNTPVKADANAEKLAKVIIAHNSSAKRGGGIGSNGTVNFGKKDVVELKVKKTWQDKDAAKRPEFITFEVHSALATKPEEKTLIGYQYMSSKQAELTIKDLPKQDNNGIAYVYTIVEEKVEGYTSEVKTNPDGLITVTNKQEIPKTTVKVLKAWHNHAGEKITAPVPSVEVELYKNGAATGTRLTLSSANNWAGEFGALPAYESIDNDTPFVYTVKEVGDDKGSVKHGDSWYSVSYDGDAATGFTIINKKKLTWTPLEPVKKTIKVSKLWQNSAGQQTTPAPTTREIEVELYKNGIATGKTLKLNADNGWKSEFTNVPLYESIENSTPFTYTVKEVGEDKASIKHGDTWYSVSYEGTALSGFTITNKEKPKTTPLEPPLKSVKVTKLWHNASAEKIAAPVDSIEVELYKNGVATGTRLTLTAANNWESEFSGLPAYESVKNPTPFVYSVKEVDENNASVTFAGKIFEVSYTGDMAGGFTITNKEKPKPPTPPTPPTPPAPPTPPTPPQPPVPPTPTPPTPPVKPMPKSKAVPKTGDTTLPTMVVSVAALAGGSLLVGALKKKKFF